MERMTVDGVDSVRRGGGVGGWGGGTPQPLQSRGQTLEGLRLKVASSCVPRQQQDVRPSGPKENAGGGAWETTLPACGSLGGTTLDM